MSPCASHPRSLPDVPVLKPDSVSSSPGRISRGLPRREEGTVLQAVLGARSAGPTLRPGGGQGRLCLPSARPSARPSPPRTQEQPSGFSAPTLQGGRLTAVRGNEIQPPFQQSLGGRSGFVHHSATHGPATLDTQASGWGIVSECFCFLFF